MAGEERTNMGSGQREAGSTGRGGFAFPSLLLPFHAPRPSGCLENSDFLITSFLVLFFFGGGSTVRCEEEREEKRESEKGEVGNGLRQFILSRKG